MYALPFRRFFHIHRPGRRISSAWLFWPPPGLGPNPSHDLEKKIFCQIPNFRDNSFIKLTFDQMSFERPFLDKVSVAFEAPWFEDELPWTSALLVQVVVLLAWRVTQAQRRCLSWKIAKRLQLRYLGKKSCRVKKLHTMILSIGQAPNLDILKKKLKVEKLKFQEKAQ